MTSTVPMTLPPPYASAANGNVSSWPIVSVTQTKVGEVPKTRDLEWRIPVLNNNASAALIINSTTIPEQDKVTTTTMLPTRSGINTVPLWQTLSKIAVTTTTATAHASRTLITPRWTTWVLVTDSPTTTTPLPSTTASFLTTTPIWTPEPVPISTTKKSVISAIPSTFRTHFSTNTGQQTFPVPHTSVPPIMPTGSAGSSPKKDESNALAIALPLLFLGVLLAIVVLFIYIRYRKTGSVRKTLVFADKPQYISKRQSNAMYADGDLSKYPRSMPLRLQNLPDKVLEMKANGELIFRDQYRMLNMLSPKPTVRTALLDENQQKNRYTDVLPFDHTRVKLTTDNTITSDYVNASFIPGVRTRSDYIASQGPVEESIDDHWCMIWQRHVLIIVMVTLLTEGDIIKREKCMCYWPQKVEEEVTYGSISVRLQSEMNFCRDNYVVREFQVIQGSETRCVHQFQYLRWPDKQNPLDPEALLEYREHVCRMAKSTDAGEHALLVHCSAGVGRSGTYIAIDTLLSYVDNQQTVDIYGLVLKLRQSRLFMVQTAEQYIFIHECLLLYLEQKRKHEIHANMNGDDGLYQNIVVGAPLAGPSTARISSTPRLSMRLPRLMWPPKLPRPFRTTPVNNNGNDAPPKKRPTISPPINRLSTKELLDYMDTSSPETLSCPQPMQESIEIAELPCTSVPVSTDAVSDLLEIAETNTDDIVITIDDLEPEPEPEELANEQ